MVERTGDPLIAADLVDISRDTYWYHLRKSGPTPFKVLLAAALDRFEERRRRRARWNAQNQ